MGEACAGDSPEEPHKITAGLKRLRSACDHRAMTALIFACNLVAYWERVGFSIAFTDIATEMGLSETEKGYVFAAYYSGYAVTQIPGGCMNRKYGGKATLALSFLLWTPASVLMALPLKSANNAVIGFIACRLVIGMAQGMLVPAAQSVLGHWVPSAHRGRYFALAMAGKFAGAATAMVTVPVAVSDMGARSTFYIASCMGAAWLAVWACAGSDAPRDGGKAITDLVENAQNTKRRSFFAMVQKKTALQDGGDDKPKPWVSTNAKACQRANHLPARPRVVPHSIEAGGASTGSDPTASSNPVTPSGSDVGDDPPGGESDDAGATEPATPTDTKVRKPARGAVGSGSAVSESTPAIGTAEGDRFRRGSDEKQSEMLCSSGPPGVSSGSNGRAVGGRNGGDECSDSILVQTKITPDFSRRDPHPPAKDTPTGKNRAAPGASKVKSSPFPWKAMSTSPAAWAVVAGGVGAGTGVNVVMSWLPTYFEEFLMADLADLSLISQLAPYLTMMAFSVLGGMVYSWLINTRGTSVPRASKVITGVSFALAVSFFLSMGLARSSTVGTLLSSLALASVAFSRGGWSTNHLEIASPEHAAMLFSIANSSGSAASVAGIAVVGQLLDAFGGSGESLAWIVALGAIGAMCGTCGVFFLVFAKGDKILFSAEPVNNTSLRGGRNSEGVEDIEDRGISRLDEIA